MPPLWLKSGHSSNLTVPRSTAITPIGGHFRVQRMKQLACAAVYIRRLVTKQPKNYMYVGNVITSGSFPQKGPCTAPQHLVCRAVQSLHINHMQMSIIEVFICRRLHMNTSMILICIWLICRLCTALHTKCCGAVLCIHDKSTRNVTVALKCMAN